MPLWHDFFKIFQYSFRSNPVEKQAKSRDQGGAGISDPSGMIDVRAMASGTLSGGGGSVKLRDTNDFVDLSTVTNRIHRYKEYERLRNMPEIEMAMTVFADEACMAGNTLIALPSYDGGLKTIEWIVENLAKERFLVYCYDFHKQDYTLGWAYNPRFVKEEETIEIKLDNGKSFMVTKDHKVLLETNKWVEAGSLKTGDELKPFYRVPANIEITRLKHKQFPRIYTYTKGWITERQFVDEWKHRKDDESYEKLNRICKMFSEGLSVRAIKNIVKMREEVILDTLRKNGFSSKELKWLGCQSRHVRTIVDIAKKGMMKVYDISVEGHANFCTDWGVLHNCQRDETGRVFQVECKDEDVKDELEYLLFHRNRLNFDQKKMWNRVKNLFINGDEFWEVIINPENPKDGVQNIAPLPADTMYRIETTKGRVIEFQQSKEGPDYNSLARVEVMQATDADLQQATAIRFAPEQIIHIRVGDDRKTFYPYGVSLIEAARGPAHTLRLCEDAMIVYRLCLTKHMNVFTKDGRKHMKDVEVGDNVFSYAEGQLIPAKVTNKWMTGVKPVYEAISRTTRISGTGDHPVLVKNKMTEEYSYVQIKELDTEIHQFIHVVDKIEEKKKMERFYGPIYARLTPKQKEKFKKTKYEEKHTSKIKKVLQKLGLEVTDKTISKCRSFLYHKVLYRVEADIGTALAEEFGLGQPELLNKDERQPERIHLPEYIDEDFARLFGFLIGDGCIGHNNGKALSLIFCAGDIEEINLRYKKLFEKYFGKCSFRQDKRCKHGIGMYSVYSVAACNIMKNMGFAGDCYTKRIPEWVFRERKEIRKAIVLGLCDADGSKEGMVNRSQYSLLSRPLYSRLGLTNYDLIEDVKHLWQSIGLYCTKTNFTPGGRIVYFKGKPYVSQDMWCITVTDKPLGQYEDIESVGYVGEEEVYDLEVDNDHHNFIANGIPVHNSRAPERRIFYIDVQQMSGYRAEAFVERMKDQFKKKKVPKNVGLEGASSVDEKWHAPAIDEDYWIPIRPNSNTRIETLPGAQNLGKLLPQQLVMAA